MRAEETLLSFLSHSRIFSGGVDKYKNIKYNITIESSFPLTNMRDTSGWAVSFPLTNMRDINGWVVSSKALLLQGFFF